MSYEMTFNIIIIAASVLIPPFIGTVIRRWKNSGPPEGQARPKAGLDDAARSRTDFKGLSSEKKDPAEL